MIEEEIILMKIEKRIPNFDTFENNIINHVRNNYFPLIYQCLYERIMPPNASQFATEGYKRLLRNNFLKLLNDIYRTRLSNKAFQIILNKLDTIKDFDDYEAVLMQFEACNQRRDGRCVNALSLGTKVLHTYNPEKNPMLDSVVKEYLGIKHKMDIGLCLRFKKAINNFEHNHKEFFSLKNCDNIKIEFKKYGLKTKFPKMKILDMALYQK